MISNNPRTIRMSQFSNFDLYHVYNNDIDEYVNKMWEMSVKIGSYNRWIAILQVIKQYKNNNRFTIELKKRQFNNIDDILYNPEIILRDTSNSFCVRQSFQRPEMFQSIVKDFRDVRMRGFYTNLEHRLLFHNINMVKDLKSRIRACGFDFPEMINMMNIDFQISDTEVCHMGRDRRRNRTELVKMTKKLVKYNTILTSKKIGRTLRHPQYYLVPNIIMNGEWHDYDPYYLEIELMEAYKRVVEYYKKHILELYLEMGIDEIPQSQLLNIIEEKFDDCCVCYEPNCHTFTNCNHVLCNSCLIQLPNKICPICRRDLNLERLPIAESIAEEKVETFDGETKEIEEEEEHVIYYDTDYQDLYDRYKLFTDTDDLCDENGDKFYRIFYKTNISDLELLKLHPTLMRNPNMKYKYKEHYTGVFIKIN